MGLLELFYTEKTLSVIATQCQLPRGGSFYAAFPSDGVTERVRVLKLVQFVLQLFFLGCDLLCHGYALGFQLFSQCVIA